MPYGDVKQREGSLSESVKFWFRPFVDQLCRLPVLGAVLLFKTADASRNGSLVQAPSVQQASALQKGATDEPDISLVLAVVGGVVGLFMCFAVGLKRGAEGATKDKIEAAGRLNRELTGLRQFKGDVPHAIAYAEGVELTERLRYIDRELRHCKNHDQSYNMARLSALPTCCSLSRKKGTKERLDSLRDLKEAIAVAESVTRFERFVDFTVKRENDSARRLVDEVIPFDLSGIVDHLQRKSSAYGCVST